MLACLQQHLLAENISGLRAVLAAAPNLVNVRNNQGLTLLHISCQFNQIETTKFLLQHAPHLLNQTDQNNSGPIFYALSHPTCLKMLIDAGANIHYRDNVGIGPLQCAVIKNLLPAAEMLLNISRRDIDVKDISGYTALFHAAMEGFVDMVRLLLKHGANPGAFNSSGLTIIESWGGDKDLGKPVNDKIATILYQHGADVWSNVSRHLYSLNRYRAYDQIKTLISAIGLFGPQYDYRCLRTLVDYLS